MSVQQRLNRDILEALKEEQEMCNEIERSRYIETVFQIDSKVKEISISEERSSSNSLNSNVNSNVNAFCDNFFEGRNNSNGKLPILRMNFFNENPIKFQSFFFIHFEQLYIKNTL